MKVVCAPDSFKESMSDAEAAAAMTRGVRSVFPDAQCVEVPMADGGEGIEQVLENASRSVEAGIGGIKIKVGPPDRGVDMTRLTAMREHLGDDFPLMVDANQQCYSPTAMRMCRAMEPFNLVWIEEPLDAYDYLGHAELARVIDTPIATGEMLASVAEHVKLIEHQSCDIIQPDARGSAASPSS